MPNNDAITHPWEGLEVGKQYLYKSPIAEFRCEIWPAVNARGIRVKILGVGRGGNHYLSRMKKEGVFYPLPDTTEAAPAVTERERLLILVAAKLQREAIAKDFTSSPPHRWAAADVVHCAPAPSIEAVLAEVERHSKAKDLK